MTSDWRTFVTRLCYDEARRKLLNYFLNKSEQEHDEWRLTREIMEDTGLARASVTEHITVLCLVTVVERSEDPSLGYPRYRPVADSRVFKEIQHANTRLSNACDARHPSDGETPLTDLYGSDARQKLSDFFLHLGVVWSEDNEPLTKSEIYEQIGVSRKAIIEHIGVLVDYGVVVEDHEFDYPRYEPATASQSFQALVELNELLADVIAEQVE